VAIFGITPELEHSLEFELTNDLVSGNQRVHVGFQPQRSVDGFLVELYFYEAVRVRSYNEVDFGPVDHNYLLDVVDHVWQLAFSQTLHAPAVLVGLEVTCQDLALVQPLGFQHLIVSGLVRVVVGQESKDKV
jgi:hypothetical protein